MNDAWKRVGYKKSSQKTTSLRTTPDVTLDRCWFNQCSQCTHTRQSEPCLSAFDPQILVCFTRSGAVRLVLPGSVRRGGPEHSYTHTHTHTHTYIYIYIHTTLPKTLHDPGKLMTNTWTQGVKNVSLKNVINIFTYLWLHFSNNLI